MPVDPLTIAAGAWAWDKYGKSLTDKAASALKGSWDKFKWNDASEKYRAKVKRLYGTMQIMGMAKPVPLDNIFTDAYMLDKPTAFSRFDIERLKQSASDPDAPPPQAKRVNGLRLVREKGNLFILGKPGAGKTTFLKYIALQAAEQNIDKIPIFVSIKEWADSGAGLIDFIAERFDTCDFPDAQPFVKELLKSGSAITLFDGLDEVSQESGQRDSQTRALNNFIEKYDRVQCLITCRLAGSDYSFQPFTYVEVADFTQKQIEQFVGKWFRNQEGETDEETSKKFLTEFARDDNKGLRDLARTPLLLTWLCLTFDETRTFPQRRVEFYKEVLDALLKKWDSSKRVKRDEAYHNLSHGHKENLLARIAAETFEQNEYFIPQHKLERLITEYVRNVPPHDVNEAADGEAILKAIEAQHGILVERAHEVYSFSHLTFQEYFTAKYIVANAARGTLTRLLETQCWDVRWREVFLLTTSLLPDAGPFMVAFRQIIDGFVRGREELKALLAWAARRSALMEGDPWITRPTYLFDALTHKDSRFLKGVLEFALVSAGSFSPDRVLDMVLARDIAQASKGEGPVNLDDARGLTRGLIVSGHPELNGLAQELAALSAPAGEATSAEWKEFARLLRVLAVRHRDVGYEWHLTEEQEFLLAAYMVANTLLKDCLELAYMPPDEKRAILESLYVPPIGEEKWGEVGAGNG